MNPRDLKIVYMGTPEFAVEPLRTLYSNGFNIVAVVTMPDKPSGRGQRLTPSPVKQFALESGLPVLQPTSLKDSDFLDSLQSLQPDLGVVVAFKMLPEVVWAMPKYGTFNLHTSLLPDYRGAAPINWAIINGDSFSGVTTFFLDKDIDTGAIIGSQRVEIPEDYTAGDLHDSLMKVGAQLVVQSIERIAAEEVDAIAQSTIIDSQMRPAPKIFKDDCRIDWSSSCSTIHNKVRGLSPYPAAWCELKGVAFKIFKTQIEPAQHSHTFGEILSDSKSYIKIAADGGYINILELQMAGKRRMMVEELLRGSKLF